MRKKLCCPKFKSSTVKTPSTIKPFHFHSLIYFFWLFGELSGIHDQLIFKQLIFKLLLLFICAVFNWLIQILQANRAFGHLQGYFFYKIYWRTLHFSIYGVIKLSFVYFQIFELVLQVFLFFLCFFWLQFCWNLPSLCFLYKLTFMEFGYLIAFISWHDFLWMGTLFNYQNFRRV